MVLKNYEFRKNQKEVTKS